MCDTCPKCGSSELAICDNDCGTDMCMECDYERYGSAPGHNPECGNDSDEDYSVD
jgi:hypothetical protein